MRPSLLKLKEVLEGHRPTFTRPRPCVHLREVSPRAHNACVMAWAWTEGGCTGDTSTKERAAQKKALPQLLVTTPESLHVLLANKGYATSSSTWTGSLPMSGTSCWCAACRWSWP